MILNQDFPVPEFVSRYNHLNDFWKLTGSAIKNSWRYQRTLNDFANGLQMPSGFFCNNHTIVMSGSGSWIYNGKY